VSGAPWPQDPVALGATGSCHVRRQRDGDRGSISPGKYADLVILSRDLFAGHEPRTILDTRVVVTIVGGQVVHRTID